jgi:ZIP family zinc transporter
MGAAAFWSFVGASSLFLGAAIGVFTRVSSRVLGLIMGFGAGTLISGVVRPGAAAPRGRVRSILVGMLVGSLVLGG